MLSSATAAAPPAAILPPTAGADLVSAFYAALSPNTLDAYRRDLADFAAYLDAVDVAMAARRLLRCTPGEANTLALAYRSAMIESGRSPSTVNRRLSALRSLTALARMLGLIAWTIKVRNLKSEPYRDTRGPQTAGVAALLCATTTTMSA